jgi:hypothetical protein
VDFIFDLLESEGYVLCATVRVFTAAHPSIPVFQKLVTGELDFVATKFLAVMMTHMRNRGQDVDTAFAYEKLVDLVPAAQGRPADAPQHMTFWGFATEALAEFERVRRAVLSTVMAGLSLSNIVFTKAHERFDFFCALVFWQWRAPAYAGSMEAGPVLRLLSGKRKLITHAAGVEVPADFESRFRALDAAGFAAIGFIGARWFLSVPALRGVFGDHLLNNRMLHRLRRCLFSCEIPQAVIEWRQFLNDCEAKLMDRMWPCLDDGALLLDLSTRENVLFRGAVGTSRPKVDASMSAWGDFTRTICSG